MIFVAEDTINQVISELEQLNGAVEASIEQLKAEQPMLLAYITSEQFDMLNTEEREYLIYLIQVLLQSIHKAVNAVLPTLEEEEIGNAEEQVWEMMEKAKGKTFRDRLDVFFEGYPQEDLLAFVEDSLVEAADPKEDDITTEGRELLFVAARTTIDAFHHAI
ncbi:MAG: hypothetical protein AAF738_02800 [Bacteroidota bacterium]